MFPCSYWIIFVFVAMLPPVSMATSMVSDGQIDKFICVAIAITKKVECYKIIKYLLN